MNVELWNAEGLMELGHRIRKESNASSALWMACHTAQAD